MRADAVTPRMADVEPFGLEVRGEGPPGALSPELLVDWLSRHRLIVLRGFAGLPGQALPDFARRLGELQSWDFGLVNELAERGDARNYLYTSRPVPFHWDGAFAGRAPRWIVFACDAAPDDGGATLFTDAVALLGLAEPAMRARWAAMRGTWRTEKVAHYGGSFTSALIGEHPASGEPVLRWAEPVVDLNPVTVELHGVDPSESPGVIADLAHRLRDPRVCLRHVWRPGDLLLADNHALLHGREGFASGAPRRLRRVNVL